MYSYSFPRVAISVFFLMHIAVANNLTAQWRSLNSPPDRAWTFAQHGSRLFAGSEDTGLWISTNGGQSWQMHQSNLFGMTSTYDVTSFAQKENKLWSGFRGAGIYVSADSGSTWESFNTGFPGQTFVAAMQQIGDTLYAAVEKPSGVYRTSIHKAGWVRSGTGFPANIQRVHDFVQTASKVFVVSNSNLTLQYGNVYVSTDFGATWLNRSINETQEVTTLEVVGNTIYAGTGNGVYVSTNDGASWEHIGLHGKFIDKIVIARNVLYAAVDGEGVLMRSAGGAWQTLTQNLPIQNDFVSTLFVHNNQLFAALSPERGGLWAYSLTSVGVNNDASSRVSLGQSYPQPAYTGSITIPFTLASAEKISLTVFDALGNPVRKLVEEQSFSAGAHTVSLEIEGLPSGIYFYRLATRSTMTTQCLIVL